jgi:hypothetical protein
MHQVVRVFDDGYVVVRQNEERFLSNLAQILQRNDESVQHFTPVSLVLSGQLCEI